MSASPYAVAVQLLSILAVLVTLPPLILHVRTKNFAASALALSTAILNTQNFINSLIWTSNDEDSWWDGKILCDIEVKLYLGLAIACHGAIASILRQVSIILDTENMSMIPSPRQRRVRVAFELFLCILLPIFVMAVHYPVQPVRYRLRYLAGCAPVGDNSWLTIVLIIIWPLVLCLTASTYCCISIVRLVRHRKHMAEVLGHSAGATSPRFFRLFALSFGLLLSYFPLAILSFVSNLRFPRHIYSWSHVHPPNWSDKINRLPPPAGLSLDRWGQIATGFWLFAFFGHGREAQQMYRTWYQWAKGFLTRRSSPQTESVVRSVTPNHVRIVEDGNDEMSDEETPSEGAHA